MTPEDVVEAVNAITKFVAKQTDNPHVQLTILTQTLAVAALTIGADKALVVQNLEQCLNETKVRTIRQ